MGHRVAAGHQGERSHPDINREAPPEATPSPASAPAPCARVGPNHPGRCRLSIDPSCGLHDGSSLPASWSRPFSLVCILLASLQFLHDGRPDKCRYGVPLLVRCFLDALAKISVNTQSNVDFFFGLHFLTSHVALRIAVCPHLAYPQRRVIAHTVTTLSVRDITRMVNPQKVCNDTLTCPHNADTMSYVRQTHAPTEALECRA